MQTKFSLIFYMKKPGYYQSGPAPIYLRITVDGKRAEMSTGRSCEPDRWNIKAGRAIGTKESVRNLNSHLDNLAAEVYSAHTSLSASCKEITVEILKNKFMGVPEEKHTLLEAIADHNDKMKALLGKGYAPATLMKFQILERHVVAFLKFTYQRQRYQYQKR